MPLGTLSDWCPERRYYLIKVSSHNKQRINDWIMVMIDVPDSNNFQLLVLNSAKASKKP